VRVAEYDPTAAGANLTVTLHDFPGMILALHVEDVTENGAGSVPETAGATPLNGVPPVFDRMTLLVVGVPTLALMDTVSGVAHQLV
jgi:hypothetical protein